MAGSSNKTDSNLTGLRYTEEVTGQIGVLPSSPVWNALEPNSYGEFGGQTSKTPRTPITAGRQRAKGVTTDLDAAAGANLDFTQDNFYDLLQGFFFANWRASASVGGAGEVVTVDGSGNDFEAAAGLDVFNANDIILARNFSVAANNGRHLVSAATATSLTVAESLTNETPPADATLQRIGVRGASGDFEIDMTGPLPALTSTVFDFTTLGLIPGAWIYVGGDAANTAFVGANNNGAMRVKTVSAARVEFDKTQNTLTTEAGGSLTVEIFVGHHIKNEGNPDNIVCRSYQFERSLSTAGYEYVKGCVANTFTLNVATADKINADVAFVGTDVDLKTSAERKAGTFPTIATSSGAFNTSSDFSRIRTSEADALSTPLFAFITDMTLTINNNVTPAKAIGTLGAFDMNIGDFVAEGNITAYFADIDAILAVRNNKSVTVDFMLAKENAGWVFDVPHLTLGEGRLSVEKDAPITIPVSLEGARDEDLDTTLQAIYFPYLPTRAEG